MAGIINMKYVTLLLVLAAVRGTDAATYVVGDSLGWTIPNGGAATYATWAAQHTYALGDILVFKFATGVHDVATVTKASFNSCSSTSPLALQTVSPVNVTLTTAGEHYFLCTFSQHCKLGQKLAVNVTSTSAGPPASPPTIATPSPTAATPSPTAPTPTPPPTTASPTMPPTAPVSATPPATSPASKGSAPAPGPIAGGRPIPASSPAPGGSAPTPTAPIGGGPTSPPSPNPATPPGPSTSPTPTGKSLSPSPPASSASRKAAATLAIGLVLVVMGVVC